MKKFLLTPLLIFFVVTVVFTSCSTSDDPSPEIKAPEGKIVATIAGASFEATGGAQIYNDEITIAGNSGSESISIFVTKAAAVGTYDVKGAALGITTPDAEINFKPDGQDLFSSAFATDGEKVGTVTITEVDESNHTVSGTFSTKVVLDGDTKEIAEGSFNKIPYTVTPPSTLSAKIDGTDFVATVTVSQHALDQIIINGQALNGSKIIMITFADNITVGDYPIVGLGQGVYATYTTGLEVFASTSGTLVITKNDTSAKRVEGTFNFTAEPPLGEGDNHTITSGSFSVSYN